MYIFINEDGEVLQSDSRVPSWEERINRGETFSTLLHIPPSGDLAKEYDVDGTYHVIKQFP